MQQDYAFVMTKNVLPSEGGYCWDAGDPGGPTKYGITCYDLAEYLGQRMDSMSGWAAKVKAMTLDTAMAIYDRKYATACWFNKLPAGLDYTMIDYDINSGVGRGPLVLSRLLGLPAKSRMDQSIMDAIGKVDARQLISAVCQERLHFMHQIRGGDAWARFGGGWGKRVAHVEAISIQLFNNGVPTSHTDPSQTQGKARHAPDPKTQKKIKTGTITGGAATQSLHLYWPPEWAILAGLAVVVGGIVVYAVHEQQAARKNQVVTLPPGLQPLLPAPPVQPALPVPETPAPVTTLTSPAPEVPVVPAQPGSPT